MKQSALVLSAAVPSSAVISALALSAASNSIAPDAAPGVPLLAVANWKFPNSSSVIGGGTYATLGRNLYTLGQPVRNMRMKLPTACNGNGGDVVNGAFTGNFAIEFRGQTFPVLFGGVASRSVAADEADVISDIIDPAQWGISGGAWPQGEQIIIRYDVLRADATVKMVTSHIIADDAANYCAWYNPSTITSKSAVVATGAMSIAGPGGSVFTQGFGYPPMLIGEPVNPATFIALGLFGDSLAAGSSDTQGTAPVLGRGFLYSLFGPTGTVAGGTIATAGNSTSAYSGGNVRTYEYFKYFTHMITSIGFNDVGVLNGSTNRTSYANIQTFNRGLWNTIRTKSPGVKIAAYTIPPVCLTSSDSFATVSGQTIGAEWGMTNGSNPESTQGLGDWHRQWLIDQVKTATPSSFVASIANVFMTIESMSGSRVPAIGDTVTAAGWTGTILGYNSAAAAVNGVGVWTISPAVPAGLSSRAMTCTTASGVDLAFGTEGTAPGRRDAWMVATTTGVGLPGNAAIGPPAPNGSGGNHPATNHYIILSKSLRTNFLGIAD